MGLDAHQGRMGLRRALHLLPSRRISNACTPHLHDGAFATAESELGGVSPRDPEDRPLASIAFGVQFVAGNLEPVARPQVLRLIAARQP